MAILKYQYPVMEVECNTKSTCRQDNIYDYGAERLSKTASLLSRAGDRLKVRAKERGYTSISQYLSRLRAEATREAYLKRWS